MARPNTIAMLLEAVTGLRPVLGPQTANVGVSPTGKHTAQKPYAIVPFAQKPHWCILDSALSLPSLTARMAKLVQWWPSSRVRVGVGAAGSRSTSITIGYLPASAWASASARSICIGDVGLGGKAGGEALFTVW